MWVIVWWYMRDIQSEDIRGRLFCVSKRNLPLGEEVHPSPSLYKSAILRSIGMTRSKLGELYRHFYL